MFYIEASESTEPKEGRLIILLILSSRVNEIEGMESWTDSGTHCLTLGKSRGKDRRSRESESSLCKCKCKYSPSPALPNELLTSQAKRRKGTSRVQLQLLNYCAVAECSAVLYE